MKINELINLADDYLNSKNRKQKSKIKCLKHILKKLRKREKKLESKRQKGVNDNDKEKISSELKLIHAHRKKGLTLLKQLQQELNEAKKSKKDKAGDI